MTYNTNQFVHVNYAPGAGGNFLITCLFLFDHVAHWSQEVQQGQIKHETWLDESWSSDGQQWVFKEPWMPWNISCYSRRMERGSNLTQSEYDRFVKDSASDYFHECWNKNLIIVDRYNKGLALPFINQGLWIDIVVDQASLKVYKFLVGKKLYIWDPARRVITSQLDRPDWIVSKYQNNPTDLSKRINYNNQYEFTEYHSFDDFFEQFLVKQNFVESYLTEEKINNGLCLKLSEMVDFDKFSQAFRVVENHFNQTINRDLLKRYHALWTARSGL